MSFEARPYQIEGRNAVVDAWRRGVNRQIVSWATGLGKTVLMGMFCAGEPDKLRGKRLILAHRDELIEQAVAEVKSFNPALRVGVEQEKNRPTLEGLMPDHVVVASVQSIMNRLASYRPDEFTLVVVDECHHAAAASYRKILEHFGFGPDRETPGRLLLGVTATPERADNKDLAAVFDEITHRVTIGDGIRNGYLARIRGHKVYTETSLNGLSMQVGDFAVNALADRVNTPARNALCVKTFLEHERSDYKRGIVFCVDVQHSRVMADAFSYAGVKAEAVWGEMPKEARRAVRARLATGETQVVTNCAVLTEGFNEPSINMVIMARPTRSQLLYTQMVGRGTRTCADLGKTHLDVFDVTDNSDKHDVVSIGTLFGFGDMDAEGGDVLDVAGRVADLQGLYPGLDVATIKALSELEQIVAQKDPVDLLVPKVPAEAAKSSSFTWAWLVSGEYRLPMMDREYVNVIKDMLGRFHVTARVVETRDESGKPELMQWEVIASNVPTLDVAIRTADVWVRKNRSSNVRSLDANAKWRNNPATDKQLAVLRGLAEGGFYDGAVSPDLTSGEASALIEAASQKRQGRKPTPKQLGYLRFHGLGGVTSTMPAKTSLTFEQASDLISRHKGSAKVPVGASRD